MRIRVTGRRAPQDMPPGEYKARCSHAEVKRRGRNQFAVLTFSVLEPGEFRGVVLRQWLAVSETLSPVSKYARQWEIASGKPAEADDDLSPGVFVCQCFYVAVGYSLKDSRGGFSPDNALECKGKDDFLRVHEIISAEDIGHSASDIVHGAQSRDGGGGGGGLVTPTITNTGTTITDTGTGTVGAPTSGVAGKRDTGERVTRRKGVDRGESTPPRSGNGLWEDVEP